MHRYSAYRHSCTYILAFLTFPLSFFLSFTEFVSGFLKVFFLVLVLEDTAKKSAPISLSL